jgi:hypothetical protein
MSAYSVHEIEELLGAYALDAVDPDERELVERHLLECPRCRAELAEHLEVAAMLAEGSPAPDGLWSRIVAALEEPPPALRLAVAPVPSAPAGAGATVVDLGVERERRRPSRLVVALAGVAAAVIVVLGVVVVRQESRIADLSEEVAGSDLADAAGKAMRDPSSVKTVLTAPDGSSGLTATAAVTADGTGYLMTPNLPALPEDRTYQLWGIVGDRVISLGVLGNAPAVSVFQVDPAVPVDGFAVTEEVAGGVVSSENEPTLVGTRS